MHDIPNSSYSAKGITGNNTVQYGDLDAMLSPSEGLQHRDRKPVETSGPGCTKAD